MKIVRLKSLLLLLLITASLHGQPVINFAGEGWSCNQKLGSSFVIDGFSFSSSSNFYTNYGYNFNINSPSIYYVFQNPGSDIITITTPYNEPLSLVDLAAYQVSEESTAGLVVEGWYNSDLKFSRSFTKVTSWQILTLNFNYINKVVIRLDSTSNGSLTDYNFDNFTFRSIITSVNTGLKGAPLYYKLNQNFPNPFNPSTLISYSIPKESLVKLSVYDILGREVKSLVNEYEDAGNYNVEFNASGFASGMYFVRLQAGSFVSVKKMSLLK